ncbi:hypothetical protein LPB90_10850 [Chryseobacterium sp. LC2016-29]|uniref:hypothetical protein n=1 Tax=Chryseobacterium sp. LC2016-29 TaxID=2897331 RepID=UPI001E5A9E79|nr:hypothetical protein [Chryseobacterium sp. LC2016-29]MCD0478957.1 hypothetical protein [Chryseobacterium sp. LC2016-29]
MKILYSILIFSIISVSFISCNNYSEDSATLLETDKYIVFTKKENIKRVFQKWLKSQQHDISFIQDDINFYNIIIKKENNNPWNVYKIADSLKQFKRINYHTAFLLETNQAHIYNKDTRKIEKIIVEKSDSDRKFKINDVVILHVIDKFY